MTATTETAAAYTEVELLTPKGPEFRHVSTAPTRPATSAEIPVIDLDGLWFYHDQDKIQNSSDSDLQQAKARIATAIRTAATGAGFFYVANHGIPEAVVTEARAQAERFFAQPLADKMRVHSRLRPLFNGYSPVNSGQINRSETKDAKEGFQFRYQPEYDPLHAGSQTSFSPELSQGDEWVWDQLRDLPGFQEATLDWWQHCLRLARGLVRLFALALDLPETYFDAVTTHPGSDGLYIRYPGAAGGAVVEEDAPLDVGIGSHTDMQCFTLLWQDESGGLEVLLRQNDGDEDAHTKSKSDSDTYEWVGAVPIPGTLVVNIADFLQRLSNDRFRSTVHRVYNRKPASRFSMPFFFGFNYDAECAVVPTCVDAKHPARYAPISCGQWRDERFALATIKAQADQKEAVVS